MVPAITYRLNRMTYCKPMSRMHWQLIRALLFLLLSSSLAACRADRSRFSDRQVRDSAGIQIVQNTTYLWPEGQGWRLSHTPLVDIGALQGDANYELYGVVGAVKLSDGRIVVANAGTNELRFFDASGRYLSTSGREGGGPGEFAGLQWLWALDGDSLMTYDWRNRRLSVFDPNGGFTRSFTLQGLVQVGPFASYMGSFADGSLLIGVQRLWASDEIKTEVHRDTLFHLRVGEDGVITDTVSCHLGAETYVVTHAAGMQVVPLAFGRSPRAVVRQNGFYFGATDSYEIGYYSMEGTLQRLIRAARPNITVTQEDIELFTERRLEEVDDANERRLVEELYAGMPFPETMPAHGEILLDAEGHLWVEEYRRPSDDQPRWTVFDPDGVMLGVVEVPPDFQVYQVGSDFVLGRWRDDLDVEHVQLYELLKG